MSQELYSSPVPVNTPWSQHIVVLCVVLPVIASIFVALRFYARRVKGVAYGSDDWLILCALIVHIIHCITGILTCVIGGTGHSAKTLQASVLVNNGKMLVAAQTPYVFGLAFTKCSACLLLRRVFRVSKIYDIFVLSLLGLSVAWAVMAFLTIFLDCRPLAYSGSCDNITGAFLGVAVIDVVVDFLILISPMPFLWRLQMGIRLKLGLTFALGLGYFTIAIGILRIVTDFQIDFEGDFTYTESPLFFWSFLEVGIAIIVACLLVLRPLLEKLVPSLKYSRGTRPHRSDKAYTNLEDGLHPLKPLSNGIGTTSSSVTHGYDSPGLHPSTSTDRHDRIDVRRDITVEEETHTAL